MKVWLIAVSLVVLGTLAGCGGGGNGSSNANNLTQTQAQQLGSAVSDDVSKALASAVGATPLGISTRHNMLVALQRNSKADAVPKPEQVTCTGSNCTISGTFACPDGGSIGVSGDFSGGGMSTSGMITETPSNCSDGTFVINGDPDVTLGLQGNDNGITTTVNLMIGGGVSFSPVQARQFPAGSCKCNLTASATVSDSTHSVTSCSVSGSICGQAINANCSNIP
jgi:hypothetical protein